MQSSTFSLYTLAALAAFGLLPESSSSRPIHQDLVIGTRPPAVDPINTSVPRSPMMTIASPEVLGPYAGIFSMPAAASTPTFIDIQGHKAQTAIEFLRAQGIVQGFPDETFRPDEPITSIEWASILHSLMQQQGMELLSDTIVHAFSPQPSPLPTISSLLTVFDPNAARTVASKSIVESGAATTPSKKQLLETIASALTHQDQSLTRGDAAVLVYQALKQTPQAPPTSPTGKVRLVTMAQSEATSQSSEVAQSVNPSRPEGTPTVKVPSVPEPSAPEPSAPETPAPAASPIPAPATLPAVPSSPPAPETLPIVPVPALPATPVAEDEPVLTPAPAAATPGQSPEITSQLPTMSNGNRSREFVDYWTALCQQNPQNTMEALAACDQLVSLNPKDAATWVARGDLLLNLHKYVEAAASYRRALVFDPKQSLVLTNECRALSALGQQDAAIAACDQALQVDTQWGSKTPAFAWYNRGVALKRLGKKEEAIAAYDKALAAAPAYSLAWTDKCRVLSEAGKQEEAIAACNQALLFNGDWGDKSPALAWYNQALALTRAGRLEAAIAAYDKVVAISPKDATSWTKQGVLLAKLGKYTEALTSYDQALKASPIYALALANRCATLNKLGRYEEALSTCDQALNGDGRWGDIDPAYVWNQRSQALAGLNRFDEALTAANRAVAGKTDYAEAWNTRGVTLWRMKRYETALASTDRALKINPNYAQGWFNYGRILRSLERNEQAIAAYDQALRSSDKASESSTIADIWANRSAVLWHLGNYQEALKSADQAIGAKPDYAQGWYNRGVMLVALKQPEEAIKAYGKATKIDPNNVYAWTGQGIVLNQLGDYEAAIAAFDEALKISPNQTLALQNRGVVMLKLAEQKTRASAAKKQKTDGKKQTANGRK